MATTCSVCPEDKQNSVPLVWCPDCGDLLCQPCSSHHSRSSATKNHKVIPYTEYQKLPPFIRKLRPYCTEHNMLLSHFCRLHDQIVCATCLHKSHRKCEEIPMIEDIVHKVKDSVLFEDTFLEMEAMCRTLNRLADNRNKNFEHLNSIYQEMKKDIENKINSKIHKNKKLSEMDTVYNELVSDISNTLETVQTKEKELCNILKQKETIKQNTSDYHAFIALKTMETILNNTNIDLSEMSENDKFMEYNLEFDINRTNEDINRDIQSVGDIRVIKGPSTVSIHTIDPRHLEAVKEVQAQRPVKLQLQQKIELDKGGDYTGCCILPSGLVVFADRCTDKIFVHESNGSLRSTIKFKESEGVFDVTPVDDHQVAVSHPQSGTISVIDVDNGSFNKGKIVKTMQIKTRKVIGGLCCRDREILLCEAGNGLLKMNIDNESIETVVRDKRVSGLSYVKVGMNIICYTCDKEVVTVLDTKYNVIFTYKDKAVFESLWGVTIDDHSNIYVAGWSRHVTGWSHNLEMISSDGKSCHHLLGEDDGLKFPTAVHYDSCTRKLAVVNYYGLAFIFSVE